MSRFLTLVVLQGLLAAAWLGCGREPQVEGQPDPRDLELDTAHRQTSELQTQVNQLRAQIRDMAEETKAEQARLEQRIKTLREVQTSLDALILSIGNLETSIDVIAESRADEESEETQPRGWPWFVKALLVLAIIVLFVLIFRRLTRDEEIEDEEPLEEGFLEENSLGTIRYPGREGDSPNSKSKG